MRGRPEEGMAYQHANIVSGELVLAVMLVVIQGRAVVVADVILQNAVCLFVFFFR